MLKKRILAIFLAVMLTLPHAMPVFAMEGGEPQAVENEQTVAPPESPEPSKPPQKETEGSTPSEESKKLSETPQENEHSSKPEQEAEKPSEPQEKPEAGEEGSKAPQQGVQTNNPSIQPVESTITYVFKNGKDIVAEQTVKNGDKLLRPGSPEKPGAVFLGWFTTPRSGGEKFENFGKELEIAPNSGNKKVTLYARFDDQVQVIFMESVTNKTVFKTEGSKPGDKVKTTTVRPPVSGPSRFEGWYTDEALTQKASDVITLGNESVTLYPKLTKGHYLIFDTAVSPSTQPPIFVPDGEPTVKPENDPERKGCTFKHWSETQNGAPYTFGKTLTDNKTLYAVWDGPSSRYTVIYWRQNIDGNGYDRIAEDIIPSEIGKEVELQPEEKNLTKLNQMSPGENYPLTFNHFHFNATKSTSTKVTVNADGSTVLNVYYDRDKMTIKLVYKNGTTEERTGLFEQEIKPAIPSDPFWWYAKADGDDYGLPFLSRRFDFDDFIKENLPKNHPGYVNSNTLMLYEREPDNPHTASNYWQLFEYYQEIDGSYPSQPNNLISKHGQGDMFYVFGQEPYRKEGLSSNPSAFKPVQVFATTDPNPPADGNALEWGDLDRGIYPFYYSYNILLRYERLPFKLTLFNEGEELGVLEVRYEKNIQEAINEAVSAKKLDIKRPANTPENYVFHWYWDETFGRPVDLEKETMPAREMKLYGHWGPPTWDVKAYPAQGAQGDPTSAFKKADGAKIYEGDLPTVEDNNGNLIVAGNNDVLRLGPNVKWVGWTVLKGEGYEFVNFGDAVHENRVYYAETTAANDAFTLTYHYTDDAGNEKTIKDPQTYKPGASALTMGQPEAGFPGVNKDERPLAGWSTEPDGEGEFLETNKKIPMTADLHLYAVFGEKPDTVSVVYDGNGYALPDGRYQVEFTPLVKNGIYSVRRNNAGNGLGFVRDGYQVVAWTYVNQAGDEVQVRPGEKIQIVDMKLGMGAHNVLKAVWKAKKPHVEKPEKGPVSFDITKVWEDGENPESKRPATVEIKLLANGEDTGRKLVLNAATGWTGRFEYLDSVKDGQDIVYTVEEENVPEGYTSSVSGDMNTGFTVTNRYKEEKKEPEKPTPQVPRMKRVVVPAKRIPRAGIGH